MNSSNPSKRILRFAHLSGILYKRDNIHFLPEDRGQQYEWEKGMLLYYIRKSHITRTMESIIQLYEYIMSVPALIASDKEIREFVLSKIIEVDFGGYEQWMHLRRSMTGFLDDLHLHPCYRP